MTDQLISDDEMITVIADFIEQGLVDNIISMFKAETSYYPLVGRLLLDERFNVRLGISILFETLMLERPEKATLAVPYLLPLLKPETPSFSRGEAVSVLGMIGNKKALSALAELTNDQDPQVAELAREFIEEEQ